MAKNYDVPYFMLFARSTGRCDVAISYRSFLYSVNLTATFQEIISSHINDVTLIFCRHLSKHEHVTLKTT